MDKGYLYVDPMKCKSEVAALDAIISNMAVEQISQGVKHFCGLIGTMLHTLEEGTPWTNKAEILPLWNLSATS